MAFACCDRDSYLYGIETEDSRRNSHYLELTSRFIEEGKLNKRACKYLAADMEQTSEKVEKQFRNKVCHLNAVQSASKYLPDMRGINSYYGCYHYCLQRLLMDSPDCAVLTDRYADAVEQYHSYSKDFVKAICTPFGYSLPRFKNLSIEDLFDKNNEKPDEDKKTDFSD